MSKAKDIISDIAHRLPDKTNIYPALNRAIRMVAKRLKYHDSALTRGALSVSISADTASGSMPTDYWGLLGQPYVSGETHFLKPIPDEQTKLLYTENTGPRWYEIVGVTIYLYPGSSSAITINGPYWARPAEITSPTDTMPYNELFDDVIQESLIHTYITGNSTGDVNTVSLMRNFINAAIDEIIPGLEKKKAKRITQAVDLNSYMWGD